ncbi:MAG: thioredoxin domain-containing protein, partial [Bauldia litoralis]
ADDAEALIVRPRSETDEATPSANAIMAQNLTRLWHHTGNDAYRADADAIIAAAGPAIAQNLFASAAMLSALDLRMQATDVVIVHPAGSSPADLIAHTRNHWTDDIILSVYEDAADLPTGHPASGKTTADNRPTAYVCHGETCSLPITGPKDLAALLQRQPV